MQTFLTSPKFDKKYIYKNPTQLYHKFCNAWAYQKMIELLNPKPQKEQLLEQANTMWAEIKKNKKIIQMKLKILLTVFLQLQFHYQDMGFKF